MTCHQNFDGTIYKPFDYAYAASSPQRVDKNCCDDRCSIGDLCTLGVAKAIRIMQYLKRTFVFRKIFEKLTWSSSVVFRDGFFNIFRKYAMNLWRRRTRDCIVANVPLNEIHECNGISNSPSSEDMDEDDESASLSLSESLLTFLSLLSSISLAAESLQLSKTLTTKTSKTKIL